MIRPLLGGAIRAASELADTIYQQELWESFDVFEKKCLLYPPGALGYFDGQRVIGYIVSHPWCFGTVVPINTVLERLPSTPDCYYLHDCLVTKEWQRQGIGRQLAQAAIAVGIAAHFRKFLLVSVNDTESFWKKLGFESCDEIEYAPKTMAHKMIMDVRGA